MDHPNIYTYIIESKSKVWKLVFDISHNVFEYCSYSVRSLNFIYAISMTMQYWKKQHFIFIIKNKIIKSLIKHTLSFWNYPLKSKKVAPKCPTVGETIAEFFNRMLYHSRRIDKDLYNKIRSQLQWNRQFSQCNKYRNKMYKETQRNVQIHTTMRVDIMQ
eukprot:265118_1